MAETNSFPRRRLLTSASAAGLMAGTCSGADEPPRRKFAAKAEDVGTIEGILLAIYDVISGPKGQPRDWIGCGACSCRRPG